MRLEAETEEGVGVLCDDVTANEGAAIVWRTVHLKYGAVGAEDEWIRAEDRDEAVVAEARLGEDLLCTVGDDDGWGEECGRDSGAEGHC